MKDDKINAISTARTWLKKNHVFLDTETTGFKGHDQVVQVAVINMDGTPLVNTLVKPTIPIPAEATAIHNIYDHDVADIPYIDNIISTLNNILSKQLTIIYNAPFDCRLLQQSASTRNISLHFSRIECAMALFAQYYGEWNNYYHNYRWQSLSTAAKHFNIELPANIHTALADAELTRQVVIAIASTEIT